jgi:hypothetical protein
MEIAMTQPDSDSKHYFVHLIDEPYEWFVASFSNYSEFFPEGENRWHVDIQDDAEDMLGIHDTFHIFSSLEDTLAFIGQLVAAFVERRENDLHMVAMYG